MLKTAPALIARLDPDLKLRFLNRERSGVQRAATDGHDWLDFVAERDRAQIEQHVELARMTGNTVSFVVDGAAGAEGGPTCYLGRIAAVPEADGRTGFCITLVDAGEQKRREPALRDAEEKLALALDATGLGLWSWDTETNHVVWDDRMRALHGHDTPLAPAAYAEQLVHPEDRHVLHHGVGQTLASGNFQQESYRVLRPDGSHRWLLTVGRTIRDAHGDIKRVMGGTLDVTRLHELTEQLRRSQKMEAITSLTAGVAHNFNNMLAVILPVLDFASTLVPPAHRSMLKDAAHAASRAAELVEQLMTYAGQAPSRQYGSHDVRELVQVAASICKSAFDAHVVLTVEQPELPTCISCNAGQIEQVLVNLLLNARDAVNDAKLSDGAVTVRIRTGVSEPPSAESQPLWVYIDVIDNGAGLSQAARAHLFEPFFTTKPVGKGTGLGLATSFAIVREHHATLSCPVSARGGTQFTLGFPTVSARPSRPGVIGRVVGQP